MKFEHWASPEQMREMVDSWSDEMKTEVLVYLQEDTLRQLLAKLAAPVVDRARATPDLGDSR